MVETHIIQSVHRLQIGALVEDAQQEVIVVKLREREGQRVDLGRSLKGHLWMVDGGWWLDSCVAKLPLLYALKKSYAVEMIHRNWIQHCHKASLFIYFQVQVGVV